MLLRLDGRARRRLPGFIPPRNAQAAYERSLRRMFRALRTMVSAVAAKAIGDVAPARLRKDAKIRTVTQLIGSMRLRWAKVFSDETIQNVVGRTSASVERANRIDFRRQLKAAVEIAEDVPMGAVSTMIDKSRKAVDAKRATWERRNVSLIKSVAEDYIDGVEDAIRDAFKRGVRPEELRRTILEHVGEFTFGTPEGRAKVIARDQIGKLQGELVEARQRGLGAKRYRWRTVGDGNRVRPEHRRREGQIFEWSDPPADGHPGKPVSCRCWAELVIDDLLPSRGSGPSKRTTRRRARARTA